MSTHPRVRAPRYGALVALLASAAPLAAQTSAAPHCHILCAPTVLVMPGVVRTHLLRGPVVRDTKTGSELRLPGSSSFEMIVPVASRTALPRLSLVAGLAFPLTPASR